MFQKSNDSLYEEIAEIEKENFSDAWSLELIKDSFKYGYNRLLTVESENGIAGYLIYSVLDVFELQRIAVRESERRKGYADKLMQALLAATNGRIILEVRSRNIPAISLYNKYGFKEIGVRRSYYTDPVDDAVIMELV